MQPADYISRLPTSVAQFLESSWNQSSESPDRLRAMAVWSRAVAAGVLVTVLALPAAAHGQCDGHWAEGISPLPGLDGVVLAAAVFNDGTGDALYVGGQFQVAGDTFASNIAKWDGVRWSAVGTGLSSTVQALTVFDDGTGPALYAGGTFSTAGGLSASRIAKWDGESWSALGAALGGGVVYALAAFDDGTGPALYAGGSFTTAGGLSANRIAKWDGSNWSALGSGMSSEVRALTSFDDGTGPALYAGGFFTTAGGVTANRIAKWDGTIWLPLGSGMSGEVRALTVFDDGTGQALYAGGSFTTAGGVPVHNIAKWNPGAPASWSALGTGLNGPVYALTVFDDGGGPAMYVGGGFNATVSVSEPFIMNGIAKFNGTWNRLASGLDDIVFALTVFDDGAGPALHAGGAVGIGFGRFNTSPIILGAKGIAKWNAGASEHWSVLPGGLNSYVSAVTVFDDGTGPALYAGGAFRDAGGVGAHRIAKWDPSQPETWSALGPGMNERVYALTVFDDGDGPALYAGGYFTTAGFGTANRIAKWNGSTWSALGLGTSSDVHALTVFDDGSGPALYVGGYFTNAGGVTVNRIAKWDGVSWSALASGMDGPVSALAVFDDGTGPALYAGGGFSVAGGVGVGGIAKWNGVSWSAVGSGENLLGVHSLIVFDDGSGPALYAGGSFNVNTGSFANAIARWDGSSWSAVGTGTVGDVLAMAVFDGGSGPALYVGGRLSIFEVPGTNDIAKWDGTAWSTLDSGVDLTFTAPYDPAVSALTVFDDGDGTALYAGGVFTKAGDVASAYFAKWYCDPPPPAPMGRMLAVVVPPPTGNSNAEFNDAADYESRMKFGERADSESATRPSSFQQGPSQLTALRVTLNTLNHPRLCCAGQDGNGFGTGCNINATCDSDVNCSGGTPLCRHQLAAGTPDFSSLEGKIRYVNSFTFPAVGGSLECPDDGPPFNTNYRCATLGCEPEYRDWAADLMFVVNPSAPDGLLFISGDAAVPSSTLEISQIAETCGPATTANTCPDASPLLAAGTGRWGDLNGAGFSAPDGKSDVLDIPPIVNKLKTVSPIFPEPRLWLKQRDPRPDTDSITVIDLSDAVDAGPQGRPYPASRTVDPCPHD